jgi:hypothetical protein
MLIAFRRAITSEVLSMDVVHGRRIELETRPNGGGLGRVVVLKLSSLVRRYGVV